MFYSKIVLSGLIIIPSDLIMSPGILAFDRQEIFKLPGRSLPFAFGLSDPGASEKRRLETGVESQTGGERLFGFAELSRHQVGQPQIVMTENQGRIVLDCQSKFADGIVKLSGAAINFPKVEPRQRIVFFARCRFSFLNGGVEGIDGLI